VFEVSHSIDVVKTNVFFGAVIFFLLKEPLESPDLIVFDIRMSIFFSKPRSGFS